jgi:hypothetical protein
MAHTVNPPTPHAPFTQAVFSPSLSLCILLVSYLLSTPIILRLGHTMTKVG